MGSTSTSHFQVLKKHAAQQHPLDFCTQIHVLKRDIDRHPMHRLTGSNGEHILNHLLKN